MPSKTNYGNPCNSEQLAAFVEERVKVAEFKQLQLPNGAFVSSLTEFLDDNPGCIEAITDWINENYKADDDDDDDDEEDDDEELIDGIIIERNGCPDAGDIVTGTDGLAYRVVAVGSVSVGAVNNLRVRCKLVEWDDVGVHKKNAEPNIVVANVGGVLIGKVHESLFQPD
jgi:hypothetical protein